MNEAKQTPAPAQPTEEPVTIPVDEACPTCHGRGTMADGVHDASCATCGGTGKVRSADGPAKPNP